jgi:hypothetical protein
MEQLAQARKHRSNINGVSLPAVLHHLIFSSLAYHAMVEIARQLDASFVYLSPGKVPDVVSKHCPSFSLFPLGHHL